MQRGNSAGSCSGCERFAFISQEKKTTGLAEELDWFLLSPSLFSSLQRAALFPGAVRAWAAGGLGLGTAHKLPSAATAALLFIHF